MDKEYRKLKLPDAGQGGFMVEISVDDIISMEMPKDSTIVDSDTYSGRSPFTFSGDIRSLSGMMAQS